MMSRLHRLFSRRFFRVRSQSGQSTSEYMLLISVISIAAMMALAVFTDDNGPVKRYGGDMTQDFGQHLTNDSDPGKQMGVN